jgi:hypothetical protein
MRSIIPGAICPEPDERWLSLPAERSAAFLPTFARISVALQTILRDRVPAVYFQRQERFRDWKSAYPMLVYQSSRPFRGRVRTELTYDVLSPQSMMILFRRAKGNLAPLLEQTETALRAAGYSEVAAHYSPRHAPEIIESVQRLSANRRFLYRLIRTESALVEALVDLSGLADLSVRERTTRLVTFRKKWQFQLRRLYPGGDFTGLAPALLDAAAQALLSFSESRLATESDGSLVLAGEPGPGTA